jgi:hypothetical protein
MDKAKLTQLIFGALARFIIVSLTGWLLASKIPVLNLIAEYIKQNEGSTLVTVTAILIALFTLCWSFVQKWIGAKWVNTALALPTGLTPSQFQAEVKAESLPATIPADKIIHPKEEMTI